MSSKVDFSRTARRFYALSDATRLRIVERLADGEQCVCKLQDLVGASQSRLSFHLKVLRDVGLVIDRREGRWVHYSLRPSVLEELTDFLGTRTPDAAGGPPTADASTRKRVVASV